LLALRSPIDVLIGFQEGFQLNKAIDFNFRSLGYPALLDWHEDVNIKTLDFSVQDLLSFAAVELVI
jgi:hypothetical protein